MIAAVNFWGVILAAVIVVGVGSVVAFVASLIHYDSRGELFSISILPFGIGHRVHRKRLKLEEVSLDHKLTQARMVIDDLEAQRLKRMIGDGS